VLRVRVGERVVWLAILVCAALRAQGPLVPLRVCEVLRDLAASDGKTVAILGRYSFRESGSWLGEQVCEPALPEPVSTAPTLLWLVEDSRDAPRPPDDFQLDAAALHRKMVEMTRRTFLGRFRFGTPDYDRWAVVYGRVELRKAGDKKATANLVFRGSGVVVFVRTDQ
jgi:hypothetical protein